MAFLTSYRVFLFAIACVIVIPSVAQNTKGDRPASNQRSILRIPHLKSKKKGGDRPYTGDVSGRRIRTKNKSSAVRANQSKPLPFARKRAAEVSRVGKPMGGHQAKFKSISAKAARNNIYSNHGRYVNNPSPRPHDNQRAISNTRQLAKVASMNTKREPPGRKKRISPRSASSSFVTRGRKNVYWGKFRKGERPVTTDITGRTLRARNFHSPGLGVIPANDVYRKRKKYGDRPYKGTFTSGFATSGKKSERAWRGDVSGHAIRNRPPKVSQAPGDKNYSDYVSNSFARKRTNKPIPVRYPGKGINILEKFFHRFNGVRNPKGGGSNSRGYDNKGQPILVRQPGIGANMGNYRGDIRGQGKAFNQAGASYSGFMKSKRPLKGGGSISGRGFRNGGQPIAVRAPGMGASMGNFSGNIKSRRSLKGGGSISGKIWNNANSAINVKSPGIGAKFVGQYQGFFRASRTPKGGGSISGSWNNRGRSINVKSPGIGAKFVGQYQGFIKQYEISPGFGYQGETYKGSIKGRRPEKGGGSISGMVWNNKGNPINRRAYSPSALKIGGYTGNIKARRPEKGGGSISEVVWNNKGNPINRKAYSPAALKIGGYTGSIKARRPEKGGGSISGKLWNNNEQPILTKAPALASANEMGYAGRIKLPFFRKKYIRNPNADKQALKKARPDKTTYEVAGLQIKVKERDYEHSKLAAKGSLKGVAPGKNSLKAAEYGGHLKMLWAYKHNPNSSDQALKTIKPTSSFTKGNAYAGGLKMKKYVHNPNSNKNALNVIAPGRAVARIKDYQGNLKMSKPNGKNLYPDAQFAHGFRGNVKQERTFLMNIKLKWAKLFKKNAIQPDAVKEKVRRPRYDKRERELWKDLYD